MVFLALSLLSSIYKDDFYSVEVICNEPISIPDNWSVPMKESFNEFYYGLHESWLSDTSMPLTHSFRMASKDVEPVC